jgi:hypothetical protein
VGRKGSPVRGRCADGNQEKDDADEGSTGHPNASGYTYRIHGPIGKKFRPYVLMKRKRG